LGVLGAGGPDLGAGHRPAAGDPDALGADAGEVRSGGGLAHADAAAALPGSDPRAEPLLLLLGAVAQERGPDLAVGHTLGRHGGAHGAEFLGDAEALEVGPPLPAVLDRDRHADPAALGETPGEALVPPGQPRVDPGGEGAGRDLGGEEIADLLT